MKFKVEKYFVVNDYDKFEIGDSILLEATNGSTIDGDIIEIEDDQITVTEYDTDCVIDIKFSEIKEIL